MSWWRVLAEALGLVRSVTEHNTHRSRLKNTPEMKKNKQAAKDSKLRDEHRKIIKDGDEDEINKRIS